MRDIKRFAFILISFCIGQICISEAQVDSAIQIFKKSANAISKINIVQYRIKISEKIGMHHDQVVTYANCILQPLLNDTLGYKYIIKCEQQEFSEFYDGKVQITNHDRYKSSSVFNIKKYGYEYVINNSINDLIFKPYKTVSEFVSTWKNPDIMDISIASHQFTSQGYFTSVKFIYKESEGTKNYIKTFYFDTISWLPVKYTVDLDLFDMHQHFDQEVTDVKINQISPDTIFSEKSFIPENFKIEEVTADTTYHPRQINSLKLNEKPAPEWKLEGLDGKIYSSEKLKSKVIILDFWFMSCYWCLKSMPFIENISEKYKDSNVIVFEANIQDTNRRTLQVFQDNYKYTFTILLNAREVSNQFSVAGFPTLFLIDKKGIIRKIENGFHPDLENVLDENIKKLIRE